MSHAGFAFEKEFARRHSSSFLSHSLSLSISLTFVDFLVSSPATVICEITRRASAISLAERIEIPRAQGGLGEDSKFRDSQAKCQAAKRYRYGASRGRSRTAGPRPRTSRRESRRRRDFGENASSNRRRALTRRRPPVPDENDDKSDEILTHIRAAVVAVLFTLSSVRHIAPRVTSLPLLRATVAVRSFAANFAAVRSRARARLLCGVRARTMNKSA